jgi:hypothetical protein
MAKLDKQGNLGKLRKRLAAMAPEAAVSRLRMLDRRIEKDQREAAILRRMMKAAGVQG